LNSRLHICQASALTLEPWATLFASVQIGSPIFVWGNLQTVILLALPSICLGLMMYATTSIWCFR
jgi:hypothetical protein